METPRPMSPDDAMKELHIIEGNIRTTGAFEVEPDKLNDIRQKLIEGKITPEQAVKEALSMERGRQDYH